MCIKSLPTNNIQRCEAWKAEARRVEGSCFMCRSKRKVCDMQVVVDRRAQEASDKRVDQHCSDLLSSAPGKAEKAEQARRDLHNQQWRWQKQQQQKQKQQRPAAAPARPARPPPAMRPGHVATQQQQQVRPTNGHSSSSSSNSSSSSFSNSRQPVGQQRIAIPMSKYSTMANARPSPMPQGPPPPPPTAPTRHRPTRERRATQHPAAAARAISPVEGSDSGTFTPSPSSPVAQVKVKYGKSYFDLD